jgi:hypothetical protein
MSTSRISTTCLDEASCPTLTISSTNPRRRSKTTRSRTRSRNLVQIRPTRGRAIMAQAQRLPPLTTRRTTRSQKNRRRHPPYLNRLPPLPLVSRTKPWPHPYRRPESSSQSPSQNLCPRLHQSPRTRLTLLRPTSPTKSPQIIHVSHPCDGLRLASERASTQPRHRPRCRLASAKASATRDPRAPHRPKNPRPRVLYLPRASRPLLRLRPLKRTSIQDHPLLVCPSGSHILSQILHRSSRATSLTRSTNLRRRTFPVSCSEARPEAGRTRRIHFLHPSPLHRHTRLRHRQLTMTTTTTMTTNRYFLDPHK